MIFIWLGANIVLITIIVLIGWLALAAWFGWASYRSFRTGVAPWQLAVRFLDRPLITRAGAPFAFWYMMIPTVIGAVFFAMGATVLVLALLGVFGPLGA